MRSKSTIGSHGKAVQTLYLTICVVLSLISLARAFDPYSYPLKSVQCDAVRREPTLEQVKIEMSAYIHLFLTVNSLAHNGELWTGYVDVGDTSFPTILMVHGWPSIWSTWSKQIEAFEKDYRLLVPDLRGSGYSSHPDDYKSSHTMQDLVHDLVCILEDAKVSSAVCMGHDWGSQICYEAARMRPDIFNAVIGLVVPYIPSAGPYVSVKQFVPTIPKLAYQTYFDRQTQKAADELNADIRRSLRATLRTVLSPPPDAFLTSETSFLGAWKHVEEIPPVPFFSAREEDYFVAAFERQGFLYSALEIVCKAQASLISLLAFGFYTEESRQMSHTFDSKQGNFTIPQPVLSVLATKDPVADWSVAMKLLNSSSFITDLTVKFVDGAHWVHLENPEPVNKAIKKWLQALPSDRRRPVDEL
ncbi:Bifunctional epoxide hydrolase 2 [Leucoagaricus sp. SymC.cos]|nr:Bifunctional epoxide hydrolase 2 [Leucoagaricus sp. SymC.cos]